MINRQFFEEMNEPFVKKGNMTMELQKERFEAWVESLPDDASFKYRSTTDCVICSFIKATTRLTPSAGGHNYKIWAGTEPYLGSRSSHLIPDWLFMILSDVRSVDNYSTRCDGLIHAPALKQITRKILGTPETEPTETPTPLEKR